MAEIDILAAFQGTGNTIDYIIWAIVGLVGLGVIAAIVYGINWLLKFDKKVTLLYPHSGGYKRVKDKCREEKDKSGNTYWRFLKTKGIKNFALRIKPPNKQYIDLDNKGKECVMFEMINPDSPIPVHVKVKEPEKRTLQECTLSSEDRQTIIDDIENTKALHEDRGIGKLIEKALPMITVVIVVIMMVIFLSQFSDSQAEIAGKVDSTMDKFTKITEEQQKLQTQLMRMQQGKDIGDGEPPN